MSFEFFGFGCFGPDEYIPEESILDELEEQIREDEFTDDHQQPEQNGEMENEF